MSAASEFLRSRWRGEVPLQRLFWRDLLGLGTLLNLLASFAALIMAAMGLDSAAAVAMHFAPTPWNAFLTASVLRHPRAGPAQRGVAVAWLVAMMVV
jgi:hypothetical protein